ncbi:C-type lectin domain family 2 member E-like isoform X1 [Chrysemys picta bellii]|uniref:C-type lectin domain family 2 member E-like isoform X1 n=1 Tax=Chrysemys picta bellii TaxID=8478 RepID=UPI0032B128E6
MEEERDELTSDTYFSLKFIKDKWIPITVTVVIAALIITVIALAATKTPPCPSSPPHVTAACPDGWVGYQGKCYYFSETEGNWNNSQSHCSSLNASLTSIDSLPELDFMQRYRGIPYHWIGLHREQGEGQPWKWTNGTIFNNLKTLQCIMGDVVQLGIRTYRREHGWKNQELQFPRCLASAPRSI